MLYNKGMKKKLAYLAMSVSLVLSFAATPIAAHAESFWGVGHAMAEDKLPSTSGSGDKGKTTPTTTTPSTTPTTKPSDDSSTSKDSTEPAGTSDDSAGRASRLEKEKKDLKETLTDATKTRISERCVAAQGLVKKKTTNNESTTTERTKAYDQIITELQAIVAAAQVKTIDVTELQGEITTLQAKITTFKTANSTYQQALTDLSLLDCKTDPVAFKAALETARTDQLAVFNSAKDIRTYLTGTVKPTLETLKAKLNSAQ
jgi:hypothetical protein